MMRGFNFVAFIACLLSLDISVAHVPKMRAKAVAPGSSIREQVAPDKVMLSTTNAVFMGECSPANEFIFPLSSGKGRGALGIMDYTDPSIEVNTTLEEGASGSVDLTGEEQAGFFNGLTEDDESSIALAFTYKGIRDAGATAMVSCSANASILVIYKDSDGLAVDYALRVEHGEDKENHETLILYTTAAGPITATAFSKSEGPHAEVADDVDILNATNDSLDIEFDTAGRVVLCQFYLETRRGVTYRSIILPTTSAKASAAEMIVESTSILGTGDVEVIFGGLPSHGRFLVTSRLGVDIYDKQGKLKASLDVVDTSAIVDDCRLVIHGGWIRAALKNTYLLASDSVDIVVVDAMAQDPQDGYHVIANLLHSAKGNKSNDRNIWMLTRAPTHEEIALSKEMREGRSPFPLPNVRKQIETISESRIMQEMPLRESGVPYEDGTGYVGARVLIHGYCSSGNSFPPDEFSYDVLFSDPKTSRSHDEFANLVLDFTVSEGLVGCSMVAHSQAGCVSLHIYNYYWSCLDLSEYKFSDGEGRLLQTLGAPFEGTALAGTLADLGAVLGYGCDSNEDMTYSGSTKWLSGISQSAREQVYYYTTAFEDGWGYDYCSIATDLFLSDPEDGMVENSHSQLSDATNMGLKEGWCHTGGMRDPSQRYDSERNVQMDFHAAF